jgi:hypothetical protein
MMRGWRAAGPGGLVAGAFAISDIDLIMLATLFGGGR